MTDRYFAPPLIDAATDILAATGLSSGAARTVASALVDADLRGIGSHGLLLLPMYVQRLRAGSVSHHERAEIVRDTPPVALLDARDALGVLTGDQAMALAVKYAGVHGIGAVSVAHAFHFGGAFRYAGYAADRGCIGLATSNTRPLMPAPGGATAVVGNNPLAIAVPRPGHPPIILDMALSEAAIGKIRLAEAAGRSIPPTWATDAAGRPTIDPTAALAGLLLPAGGPKGYGLALMMDVLTGVLSGGAFGSRVNGLYRDTSVSNDCAHFFLAIDPAAFIGVDAFAASVTALAEEVLSSTQVGPDPVLLPGQREAENAARAREIGIPVDAAVLTALVDLAADLGVALPPELTS